MPRSESLRARLLEQTEVLLLGRRPLGHRGIPNHHLESVQLADQNPLLLLGVQAPLGLLARRLEVLMLLLQMWE